MEYLTFYCQKSEFEKKYDVTKVENHLIIKDKSDNEELLVNCFAWFPNQKDYAVIVKYHGTHYIAFNDFKDNSQFPNFVITSLWNNEEKRVDLCNRVVQII